MPRPATIASTPRCRLICGCAFDQLPRLSDGFVDVTITSPPYFRQKDYGIQGQIGWEPCLDDYLAKLRAIFAELHRVTADSGTCFFVIGDSYAKRSLQLVPQRAAIQACESGWTLRNDLIWSKLDATPGSGADRWRFTHEHVLFLSKRPTGYKFHADAIRVAYNERTLKRWGNGQKYGGAKASSLPGASSHRFRKGKTFSLHPGGTLPPDVVVCPTSRSHLNHFATFPLELVEQFVEATTDPNDLVFDPFAGTATTGAAALRLNRRFLGIELSRSYLDMARQRLGEFIDGSSDGEASAVY